MASRCSAWRWACRCSSPPWAWPRLVTAGTATSFAIHFIVLVAPRNQMDYDLATLLNSAQGVLIGVGFAAVIFRLLTLRPG